jgi:hypothetical protein
MSSMRKPAGQLDIDPLRQIHEPQTDGRVDLYENVQIAGFGLLTSRKGAEQGQPGQMEVPREFRQGYP